MRLGILSALLVASCALGEETGDRTAIEKTLSEVAMRPFQGALYTRDFRFAEVEQLGVVEGQAAMVEMGEVGRVVISKEPWGEATWGAMPRLARDGSGRPVTDRLDGTLAAQSMRFLTADVALVDAVLERRSEKIGVLVVMQREDGEWRIASLRKVVPAQ